MLISCLLFHLLANQPLAAAARTSIGAAKTVQGDAIVLRGGVSEPCREGMHLFEKDEIRTQPGARVGIILLDGARLAIGEKTQLKINRFLFEPSESKYRLALQIVKGVVAYFSGKIAAFSPQSVELQTPVGMVGTRGTALAMKIEPVSP